MRAPTITFHQHIAAGIPLYDARLVWITVQGHERRVLMGASSLLETDTLVVCEYWPHGLRHVSGLERFGQLDREHDARFSDFSAHSRRPTSEIVSLRQRYLEHWHDTNVLLVKQ